MSRNKQERCSVAWARSDGTTHTVGAPDASATRQCSRRSWKARLWVQYVAGEKRRKVKGETHRALELIVSGIPCD